jgi:hypothetical protein
VVVEVDAVVTEVVLVAVVLVANENMKDIQEVIKR